MILFDTNVLLDIASTDPVWLAWSEKEFGRAVRQGPIPINPIIYPELAAAFATTTDLDHRLDSAVLLRLSLPYDARWFAWHAFLKYRRSGGHPSSVSPTIREIQIDVKKERNLLVQEGLPVVNLPRAVIRAWRMELRSLARLS